MSVLRINQNPIAINAHRNLRVTEGAITKSLERLSSGLRINRAADDAAGLSISEKLRAQIRGLNRASANALDGISLIQTAEGALNEIHTILQRVRELAVQGANGIYTANDRAALQLEVKELVAEIDRITSTTEFNTKRLLDGTLGALISTDDFSKVSAAVTGSVGDGGNYVLKAIAKSTGSLQVQKSDVFATQQETDAVGKINYLQTLRADATVLTAGPSGVGNTGMFQVEVPVTPNGSVAMLSTTDGTFRISGARGSTAAHTIGQNLQAQELSVDDRFLMTLQDPAGVTTVSFTILSLNTTNAVLSTQISAALGGMTTGVGFNAGANNNYFSVALAGGAQILNTEFIDADGSGSRFKMDFSSIGISNRMFASITMSFFNNGSAFTQGYSRLAGDVGTAFSVGDANTGAIMGRFDTEYDWSQVSLAGATQTDSLEWSRQSGDNSLQEYGRLWQDGSVPESATFVIKASDERTFSVYEFDNSQYTDLVTQGWDQGVAIAAATGAVINDAAASATHTIDSVYQGEVGSPLEGVRLAFDGILQAGETATFNVSTNNVLTADQLNTLASINRFQDFGVFNGRQSVELTMYLRGTDHVYTANLSTNDTLEDLASKISLGLWNSEGSGIINSGILNPDQMPDLVHVNTIGVAKGTLSIVTPIPGAQLVLTGDEALMKALSLVEVRDSTAAVYSVTAYNMELNKSIGSIETDSNQITGLLPGLTVFFDNTLGLRLDPQPPIDLNGGPNTILSFANAMAYERPEISITGEIETFFMHVAPREFSLQTGANQGQTIAGYIGDHSSRALGIEGLLVVDSDLAQEAISIVDAAIDKVSTQRSRLGAIQNRLESTIRNLDISAENLTSAESRIRDVDVALETIMSTRNQILLQAGVAALAQANQLPQTVLQLLR